MKPVRTESSNLMYVGPPGIGDLHAQRIGDVPGEVVSVWWLTPAERERIAAGANIRLGILTEPIPPVRLELTDEQGIGEDAPDKLERLEQAIEYTEDELEQSKGDE